MKIFPLSTLLAAVLLIITAQAAVSRDRTIEGRIYGYECGDNCYYYSRQTW
jgi:hypothetical protein